MLTLNKTLKVGRPQPLRKFDHSGIISFTPGQKPKYIELDAFDEFSQQLQSKDTSVVLRTGDIGGQDVYHQNYLGYLEKCWADHLGIVFTPDILWYSLLCELTLLVSEHSEKYRYLFSDKQEKQEIVICSDSDMIMPLGSLIIPLSKLVPTNTDRFLPLFSTSNINSIHAFHAAFADMCSPYYNYSMYCCGFPCIDIQGCKNDYQTISDNFKWMANTFKDTEPEWFAHVNSTIGDILENLENPTFWANIFNLERCGSGGQLEAGGWFPKLFRKQPSIRFIDNFSTHLSQVNYKNLDTQKNYVMKVGLLSSNMKGDTLVPDFGYLVYEKKETG